MRHAPELRKRTAAATWRRSARRIALIIVVGAVLAGCDRCGDLAFPGTSACRQEAPKQR
jgi:hypothetical protein